MEIQKRKNVVILHSTQIPNTPKIPHSIFSPVYTLNTQKRENSKKQITLINGWKWRSKLTLAWCLRSSNASSIYRAFLCKFSTEALNAFGAFSFHSCNNRNFLTSFIEQQHRKHKLSTLVDFCPICFWHGLKNPKPSRVNKSPPWLDFSSNFKFPKSPFPIRP